MPEQPARRLRSLTTWKPGDEGYVPNLRHAWQTSEGWFYVLYGDRVRFLPHGSTGHLLPERFEVRVWGRYFPYTVALAMQVLDSRPECISLLVDCRKHHLDMTPGFSFEGHETNRITSLGLRDVPIERLIQDATLAAVHRREGRSKPKPPLLLEWADLYATSGGPATRGESLTDEHYRRVADVYRQAARAGDPPTKAVAAALHGSRSTAGRWVVEARARGFLGPTSPGRAGETAPTRKTTKRRK